MNDKYKIKLLNNAEIRVTSGGSYESGWSKKGLDLPVIATAIAAVLTAGIAVGLSYNTAKIKGDADQKVAKINAGLNPDGDTANPYKAQQLNGTTPADFCGCVCV